METIADLKEHLAKQSAALKLARAGIYAALSWMPDEYAQPAECAQALAAIDALGE